MFKRKYIFKGSIFHCYVSLPEAIFFVGRIQPEQRKRTNQRSKNFPSQILKARSKAPNRGVVTKVRGETVNHRENGGKTLGGPLMINPIYTLYHVGIYWGPYPLYSAPWGFKQQGALHPKGFPHHFPYEC